MAGDWMKIELELPDKPEVHGIAGMLSIDPDAVVGKLIRVWQWFDKHTTDGNAYGVTYALCDRITNVTGFGEAMAFVGWLEQRDKTLHMPKFDRHTSESAKTRALAAKRQSKFRNSNDESNISSDANSNAPAVTVPSQREEKRRVNNTTTPGGFAEFWSAYPRKEGKVKAEQAWKKLKPDLATVLSAIASAKNSDQWRKDSGQYIPHPATWINGKRWEDGQEQLPPAVSATVDGDIVTLPNGQKIPRAAYELNRRMMA